MAWPEICIGCRLGRDQNFFLNLSCSFDEFMGYSPVIFFRKGFWGVTKGKHIESHVRCGVFYLLFSVDSFGNRFGSHLDIFVRIFPAFSYIKSVNYHLFNNF